MTTIILLPCGNAAQAGSFAPVGGLFRWLFAGRPGGFFFDKAKG